MKSKRWGKTGWLLTIPALLAAVALFHYSFPIHPLQRRWRELNPIGVCGPGPEQIVEFGSDGFVRTYRYFGSEIFSKDGHGDPVPYSVSGNKIVYHYATRRSEIEFSISGESLTMRMPGTEGTEWENYVFQYEAE